MDKKALLLTLFVAAGSKGNRRQEETAQAPLPEPPSPAQPLPEPAAEADPNGVLVTVNGVALTRAEAETEADIKLGDRYKNLPPQLHGAMRQRMLNDIVEQFVAKRVLLEETDRRGIEATAEDEKEAFDKIQANLPAGKTVKEVMQSSPMGEGRMREEIITGIRINKLLALAITNEIVVSDAEVATFVEENQQKLQRPERAHARHILFAVQPEDGENEKALKKEKAESVRNQLLEGSDFAQMAKLHSDCPSADRGGDLAEFPRGRMVPPFEQAAFGQPTNEIGAVIETKFGYHIVQVLERFAADRVPDENVLNTLRNRKYQENVKAYVESLKPGAEIKYEQ